MPGRNYMMQGKDLFQRDERNHLAYSASLVLIVGVARETLLAHLQIFVTTLRIPINYTTLQGRRFLIDNYFAYCAILAKKKFPFSIIP